MKNFQKINLDNRLFLCAQKVRPGKVTADIGTDHAYLPIWLVLNNIAPYAIATDVREGPLRNAEKNIAKFGVADKVKTCLSDGLNKLKSTKIDEIVIAGMGGELIAKIIKKAAWLKDSSKHLILQPMSAEPELRAFLISEKFKIFSEQAVISAGKVYTVMSVFWSDLPNDFDKTYPYIGGLKKNLTQETQVYIKKTVKDLKNKQNGCVFVQNFEKAHELQTIIAALEQLLGGKFDDESF